MCCKSFVLFLLTIVLSDFLRFTDYECPLGIFKLFLANNMAMVMVFNATFNNISVISRRTVTLVEETGVSFETHRPVESH